MSCSVSPSASLTVDTVVTDDLSIGVNLGLALKVGNLP